MLTGIGWQYKVQLINSNKELAIRCIKYETSTYIMKATPTFLRLEYQNTMLL